MSRFCEFSARLDARILHALRNLPPPPLWLMAAFVIGFWTLLIGFWLRCLF
jgi:hypothetical protein